MADQTAGVDEVHCFECGEIIKEKAEICPECGVRQHQSGGTQSGHATATSSQPQSGESQPGKATAGTGNSQTAQGDYGILFAHVDANQRKKLLRNLFDLGLVFVSVGFYIGVMVAEGLRHYYRLNRGAVEPYDAEVHENVWIV